MKFLSFLNKITQSGIIAFGNQWRDHILGNSDTFLIDI